MYYCQRWLLKLQNFAYRRTQAEKKVIKTHFQESARVLGLGSKTEQETDTLIIFVYSTFINSISCLHQLIFARFYSLFWMWIGFWWSTPYNTCNECMEIFLICSASCVSLKKLTKLQRGQNISLHEVMQCVGERNNLTVSLSFGLSLSLSPHWR